MTDQLGHRARIALVVPSTNTSCQPESEMLRPLGVTNQTGRISIKERPLTSDQAFMEHVQAMRDGMRTAIDQVMTCQPTHVIMGVALEAFWGGVAAANELQRELAERAGVGVSMGSTATFDDTSRRRGFPFRDSSDSNALPPCRLLTPLGNKLWMLCMH